MGVRFRSGSKWRNVEGGDGDGDGDGDLGRQWLGLMQEETVNMCVKQFHRLTYKCKEMIIWEVK